MSLILDQDALFPYVASHFSKDCPVLMYGMGNGAEKVIKKCKEYGIKVQDIFASDQFVRGQAFLGYQVKSYSEICQRYSQAIILIAFGTADPLVLDQIKKLAKQFEVLIPDLALFGEERDILTFEDFIKEAYYLYEPESREIYANLINYKITGKLKYLEAATTSKAEAYQLLNLQEAERYVDAGAYDGDTIREVLGQLQAKGYNYQELIAIEPDPKNFRKLENFAESSGLKNFQLINVAISDLNGELRFDNKAGRSSSLSELGNKLVKAMKLDDLIKEPITLLKMDVEGAEREALLGSRRILQQDKPRLIISAYHRSGDILELPKLIKEINPDYRLNLRHHPYVPAWDTNIYAW